MRRHGRGARGRRNGDRGSGLFRGVVDRGRRSVTVAGWEGGGA